MTHGFNTWQHADSIMKLEGTHWVTFEITDGGKKHKFLFRHYPTAHGDTQCITELSGETK